MINLKLHEEFEVLINRVLSTIFEIFKLLVKFSFISYRNSL